MQKLNINLSKDILVREEGDHILFYHCKNDAVLKISRETYQQLLRGEVPDTKEFRGAIKTLGESGMLDGESNVSQFYPQGASSAVPNLFGLKSLYNPFIVLWAITSACNLKCIYCFPDVKSVQPDFISLPFEALSKIVDQLIEAKVFQLTITGGEAFLNPDIWRVVEKARKNNIKVIIISNGTTITDEIIGKLKKFEIIVGVSLDAPDEEINSKTRGKGVFDKTVAGIRVLKKARIQVVVLVTLTRFNFPYLDNVIQLIHEELGVMHVTLQDLKHFGTKNDYENLRLTMAQEKTLYDSVSQIRQKYSKLFFNVTELFMFPCDDYKKQKNGKIMECPAGHNMVYIDFYGDMYPCTSLSTMKLGNVIKDGGITELWRNSAAIQRLRLLKDKSVSCISGCKECSLSKYCDGGCRGDAIYSGNGLYGRASRCPKLMGTAGDE
jgi:radical SAM protein with 4Fe4S-binding SPASM domain